MVAWRRLRECVERWPECEEGKYDPACCRFPKSCSCDVYDPARVTSEQLEGVQSPCCKMESRLCPALIGTCGEVCERFDTNSPEVWAIEVAETMKRYEGLIDPP